jgi:hypothetical protein
MVLRIQKLLQLWVRWQPQLTSLPPLDFGESTTNFKSLRDGTWKK